MSGTAGDGLRIQAVDLVMPQPRPQTGEAVLQIAGVGDDPLRATGRHMQGDRELTDAEPGQLGGSVLAMDEKAMLVRYLQRQRDPLIWKLSNLTERQLRMPMTPTGTNLLGVAKHVASTDVGYFGEVFGRPFDEPMPWMDDENAEPNSDMWATAEQSADWVRDFCRRAWSHSDATIEALELRSPGLVPWWPPERRDVELHTILIHVIAETARHVGQLDIVRELIDGQAGIADGMSNLPELSDQHWQDYTQRLRELAESFDD